MIAFLRRVPPAVWVSLPGLAVLFLWVTVASPVEELRSEHAELRSRIAELRKNDALVGELRTLRMELVHRLDYITQHEERVGDRRMTTSLEALLGAIPKGLRLRRLVLESPEWSVRIEFEPWMPAMRAELEAALADLERIETIDIDETGRGIAVLRITMTPEAPGLPW